MSDRAPDYAQGFKDGFAAGLEEGKKLAPKQIRLDDYLFDKPGYLGMPNTCQVCGRNQSGVQGYVCYDPKCPTKVTWGTPMTGVVGNDISYSYGTGGIGANGPAGPIKHYPV